MQYKLHTAHMYLKCYFGWLQINIQKDMYAQGAESMASHALLVFLVLHSFKGLVYMCLLCADLPETLLRLVQDISMQLTFRNMDLAAWEQQPNPAALSFASKSCMYPEKVFVSALCQSQFLIGQIRSQGYGPIGRQPTSFKPSTESNAGVHLHMCVCVYVLLYADISACLLVALHITIL